MAAMVEAAKGITFAQCAAAYIDANRSGWSNAKHAQQWTNTLTKYAYPIIGHLPIVAVDTSLVIQCLEPIWQTKSETASRVRGRIEAVLDYATTREYRQGENPARWKGHLSNILPAKTKVAKVEHHAALDFRSVPEFLTELRQQEGMAAMALEFAILTATRTSETLNATWSEIDMKTAMWTIPAPRMKGRREHRVPLSKTAIATLKKVANFSCDDCSKESYVFPGQRQGRPLSNMAMLMLLRRMNREDLTTHGFRSSFRDWGAETTNYPNELLEMALAHVVGDKVEAAYRRGDLFGKRKRLMQSWADHLEALQGGSEVVQIRQNA
jgi:integrase